jgi:hypothetical protein
MMQETTVIVDTALDAGALASISAAVVALTQLSKWAGLPDRIGPAAVLVFAALGMGVWAYSEGQFAQTLVFEYFSGWIVVATSAAGIYGFTRAGAEQLARALPPPTGSAGGSPTIKS